MRLYFSADGKDIVLAEKTERNFKINSLSMAMKQLMKFYGKPDFYDETEESIRAYYGDGFYPNAFPDGRPDGFGINKNGTGVSLEGISCGVLGSTYGCTGGQYNIKIKLVNAEEYWKADKAAVERQRN